MMRHVVWAVAAYALAIVVGVVVLIVTGHALAVDGFVAGTVAGPLLIGFVLVMLLGD